jgi:hypothetical protein
MTQTTTTSDVTDHKPEHVYYPPGVIKYSHTVLFDQPRTGSNNGMHALFTAERTQTSGIQFQQHTPLQSISGDNNIINLLLHPSPPNTHVL